LTLLVLALGLAGCLLGQAQDSHIAAARAAEQAGNFAAAEREYRSAIALRPSAELYQRLGLVLHLENKYREAIPEFEASLRLDPDQWAARLFLGMDLYRTNQFDRALAELKKAERLRPEDPDTRFWLGATYLARKEYFPGLEILERLSREQPRNLEIMRLLAENYAAFGTALLNQVAEKYSNSPAGMQVHAQALEFEGANEAALKAYRELDRIAPGRPGVREGIERLQAILSGPRQPAPPAGGGAPPSRP
jgi:tetratricopeptide (TPR) repeat protein